MASFVALVFLCAKISAIGFHVINRISLRLVCDKKERNQKIIDHCLIPKPKLDCMAAINDFRVCFPKLLHS